MRREVDASRLRDFLRALGRASKGPGRVYLTGGATALLHGWRPMTKDVDLHLDPEPAEVDPDELGRLFARLDPAQLLRYPALDADGLAEKVRAFLDEVRDDG